MIRSLKLHWPLVAALTVLWAVIAIVLMLSLRQNQGHLIYALDDPYISMAVAKNLAEHGVWGVGRYEFSSSSSSLLWTLLLYLTYMLFGINDAAPFILNVIFGSLLVVSAYLILRRCQSPPLFTGLVLLTVIACTPLPSIIFCGMEHPLHALLTILFVQASARSLSGDLFNPRQYLFLLLLATLVVLTRYEGIFALCTVSLLFIFRKRLVYGIILGGVAILPVVIFGLISVSHGSFFLPNPVILKGAVPEASSFTGLVNALGYNSYRALTGTPSVLFLLIASLALPLCGVRREGSAWKYSSVLMTLFCASVILHMQFASLDYS